MARWLAKYGFNLVRIGHLVTGPEQGFGRLEPAG